MVSVKRWIFNTFCIKYTKLLILPSQLLSKKEPLLKIHIEEMITCIDGGRTDIWCLSQENYGITEYSELEGTHESHWVQLWSEWPMWGSNTQLWHYQHAPLTSYLKSDKAQTQQGLSHSHLAYIKQKAFTTFFDSVLELSPCSKSVFAQSPNKRAKANHCLNHQNYHLATNEYFIK